MWDLLWLSAQHRSFVLRPKAGVGLEFGRRRERRRVFIPLGDNVGWLRAILARMAGLLKDLGAVTATTGHYGFSARVRMPDGAGVDRPFEVEMKNNQREGISLAVRQTEHPAEGSDEMDSAGAAAAE